MVMSIQQYIITSSQQGPTLNHPQLSQHHHPPITYPHHHPFTNPIPTRWHHCITHQVSLTNQLPSPLPPAKLTTAHCVASIHNQHSSTYSGSAPQCTGNDHLPPPITVPPTTTNPSTSITNSHSAPTVAISHLPLTAIPLTSTSQAISAHSQHLMCNNPQQPQQQPHSHPQHLHLAHCSTLPSATSRQPLSTKTTVNPLPIAPPSGSCAKLHSASHPSRQHKYTPFLAQPTEPQSCHSSHSLSLQHLILKLPTTHTVCHNNNPTSVSPHMPPSCH